MVVEDVCGRGHDLLPGRFAVASSCCRGHFLRGAFTIAGVCRLEYFFLVCASWCLLSHAYEYNVLSLAFAVVSIICCRAHLLRMFHVHPLSCERAAAAVTVCGVCLAYTIVL